MFRAATEVHVFLVIAAGLALRADLSNEVVTAAWYDWGLFISFLVLVPGMFVCTVASKVWSSGTTMSEDSLTGSFSRLRFGLASDSDRAQLSAHVNVLRREVTTTEFAAVLEGRNCEGKAHQHVDTDLAQTVIDQPSISSPQQPGLIHNQHHLNAQQRDEEALDDPYYQKFEQGYVGVFADMQHYFGGLEHMIGECRKDVLHAMEEEHCAVTGHVYGASHTSFTTANYRVTSTPAREWMFVVDPSALEAPLDAGFDSESGRDLGTRKPKPASDLLKNAAQLLSSSFAFKQCGIVVTQEQINALPLLLEEVIALRLYTGPMFSLYNGVLRAWGNADKPGFVPRGPHAGMDVRGMFTTTIHAVNSGVLKLSRLQPALSVFRGATSMKLPRRFLERDSSNIRGGVEFGFMSDYSVHH